MLLGSFRIDSRLGCTPYRGCQVPGSGSMQAFNWMLKAFEHLGATTGIEWLNCLAARSQTLQCFGKVCQQLHYLCESAVQSDNIPCEASYGVSICLVMRLKRSPHLSRVCHSHQTLWREQFSCCMLETHFWKGDVSLWVSWSHNWYWIVWQQDRKVWRALARCVNNCITSVSLQSRATIFHAKHLMGCPSAWSCG